MRTQAQKLGHADGIAFFEENDRKLCEEALAPGQLGADEGLINALGYEAVAKLFGVPKTSGPVQSEQFQKACEEYNRAWEVAVARALKARAE